MTRGKYVDDMTRRFGRRLRTARGLRGLTQTEAARAAGMSQRSLSDAERGESELRASTLVRLSDLYGVSLSWLLCQTDETTVRTPRGDVVTIKAGD